MGVLTEIFGPRPPGVRVPSGLRADFALLPPAPLPPLGGVEGVDFALAPPGSIKVEVKSVPQTTDYSCGACALAAVADYFGLAHGDPAQVEKEFIALCKTTPLQGTTTENLVEAARRLGLRVMHAGEDCTPDQLDGWLARGFPVIVDLQAWGPLTHPDYARDVDDGHYVVVIGSDADKVYFEDPLLPECRASLPRHAFLRAWHDANAAKVTSRWAMALSRDQEALPMG